MLSIETLEEIRKGNIKAFEQLFNLYYIRVRTFAFNMNHNMENAENVAQNVFMKIWLRREELTRQETLDSYIFTIVKNEVYDTFRRKNYALDYQEFLKNRSSSDSYEIDSDYNIKEIKRIVEDTVQQMPDQRQLIFRLSRQKFMSNEEIANLLNISKRTVEKHISLALAMIRQHLGDFLFWLFVFFIF